MDARDVAAVAARALTDPQQIGARHQAPLTLTGPQALSFGDAAVLLSEELGRTVRYRPQRLFQRRRDLLTRGVDPGYVRVQLVIDVTTRLGMASTVTGEISAALGRPPRTLATFVRDHRAAWAPAATST